MDGIKKIGEKHKANPSQITLAWLLAQGKDIIPIPGTKNPKVWIMPFSLEISLTCRLFIVSPRECRGIEDSFNYWGGRTYSQTCSGHGLWREPISGQYNEADIFGDPCTLRRVARPSKHAAQWLESLAPSVCNVFIQIWTLSLNVLLLGAVVSQSVPESILRFTAETKGNI